MAKRYENNKEGDVHDCEEETQEDIYANWKNGLNEWSLILW